MLLYVMLYIVLAYLMLFAAITNAVCLNNASFFSLICANASYFHALSLFISFFLLICIMHSAFNLFVFPNYMFTSLLLFFVFFNIFYERAMSSPEKLLLLSNGKQKTWMTTSVIFPFKFIQFCANYASNTYFGNLY